MVSERRKVTIRQARADDVGDLVRVINAAFEVERFFINRDRTDPDAVRKMLSTGAFLVGEDRQGAIVASVYVERRGDRGYFGLLSVAPDRKREGLGRQMIDAVEAHFRALGCRAVDMRVVNLRSELPPIYRRLGYVEQGTEPFNDPRAHVPCHFIRMSKAL